MKIRDIEMNSFLFDLPSNDERWDVLKGRRELTSFSLSKSLKSDAYVVPSMLVAFLKSTKL